MFTIHNIGKYSVAIAFISAILNFSGLPSNAQTDRTEYYFLEDVEARTRANWDFPSEDESTSIKDDLQELSEYDLSESDLEDIQLVEEDRKWGNKGDARNYSIEAEIYDY